MVIKRISQFFCLMMVLLLCVSAQKVTLKLEVQSEMASQDQPITATVVISHPFNQDVDINSFKIDSEPINAQLISDGMRSFISKTRNETVEVKEKITTYAFQIPGKKVGKHTLDALEVKVGEKSYKTEPQKYEIFPTQEHSDFRLTAQLDHQGPLYKGQKVLATYRIIVKSPIELISENLPLLNLPGFKKIGERKVRAYQKGDVLIQEYSQLLEASSSGDINVENSFVEGFAYREDFFGRRSYYKKKLKAETKTPALTILEFPSENKPLSFNGALGPLDMDVVLISANEVNVGDKLELEITLNGFDVSSLKLPALSKQKGFESGFRFSDLPPSQKTDQHQKSFVVELRAMKDSIKQIPSIEYSYFDASSKTYHILKSDPIAVNIKALPSMKKHEEKAIEDNLEKTQELIIEEPPLNLIEIQGVYPIENEKTYIQPKISTGIYFILIAFTLYAFLWVYKKRPQWFIKSYQNPSYQYLNEACQSHLKVQMLYELLEKALIMRLKEKGLISDVKLGDDLGTHGIIGEVRHYLHDLQDHLFSGQGNIDIDKNQKRAKQIYKKIGEKI